MPAPMLHSAGWLVAAVIWLVPAVASGQTASAKPGTISGRLSYPSDYVPEKMEVCAEPVTGGALVCTRRHVRIKARPGGTGYALKLPAGSYHIFARLPADAEESAYYPAGYRAYYSESVRCGLSVNCTSHAPVAVDVAAGQMVTGIDPGDWYNR